ncbi:unnamed protein product [Cochlearia groenlandica]
MHKKRDLRVFFATLLIFTIFSRFSFARITKQSPLSIGQTLSSSNGVYELGFFSPNNSKNHQYIGVWYKGIVPRVVVWVANRERPVTTESRVNLTISNNGNLQLLDGKLGLVVWSTGEISLSDDSRAELSDNGNLVVVDNVSDKTLWESFKHLGDSLLPLAPLMYNPVTGENRVLTNWKSHTDPSPGDFTALITHEVPSQLCIMKGSTRYYRTGPWAKTRFAGIPLMDESLTSPFVFQQDGNGLGSFSFFARNSRPSRINLTPEGSLVTEWFHHNGTGWEGTYKAPANACGVYGVCGPFGLCFVAVPIKCKCFKGFVPKHIAEWKRGNWTDGCVRRTELNCRQNVERKDANVFHPVPKIKLPDFHEFVNSVDTEDCYRTCNNNCSCVAFSFVRGIGCLIWNRELMDVIQFSAGGELLSIRLASSELGGINKRKKTIIATIVSLSLFVILASASLCFWRNRVKHKGKTTKNASEDALGNEMEPQDVTGLYFFEMSTIITATNNFSLSNKLGQGGFGSVYKGKLQDGKEIAVKRLSSSSGQGKEEFMNEIVLISKLQHKNLVRILGCCIEGEERLLIYEYMLNKSLDTFLFDSRKRLEIDWPKRFSIIQGIARGLLYLHRDSCLRVIHRDLKVSNILLDEKMNPKISDFGLARIFQGTEYQDTTRRVVGTLGYMAPEYAWTGMFSEKSDIYSFGVLMLEIISGERISRFSYGEESKTLTTFAWESWCNNGGIDLLDQEVDDSCQYRLQVKRCVQIGLLCVQHKPIDRPNTLELMSMLTTTTTTTTTDNLPSPKQPTYSFHTKEDDGSLSHDLISINQTTQSLVLAR